MRRVDGAIETRFDQFGQQAAVVDVGVRQNQEFGFAGVEWKFAVVQLLSRFVALKQAAID